MDNETLKQKARLSILERLKMKPVPAAPAQEEETMNDIGISPDLEQRLKLPKKKKKPQMELEESDEVVQPTDVTGSY